MRPIGTEQCITKNIWVGSWLCLMLRAVSKPLLLWIASWPLLLDASWPLRRPASWPLMLAASWPLWWAASWPLLLAASWLSSITRTFTLNAEPPAWLPLTLKLERWFVKVYYAQPYYSDPLDPFCIERGFPAERETGERETSGGVVHIISTI